MLTSLKTFKNFKNPNIQKGQKKSKDFQVCLKWENWHNTTIRLNTLES